MHDGDQRAAAKRTDRRQGKTKKQTRRPPVLSREAGYKTNMQVVTLNPTDLEEHARRLAYAVERGATYRYAAIVAVRRGGSLVCDSFCRYYPKERFGERFDVTLQRPSTKRKEGKVSQLLRHLPLPILDSMRIAESIMLSILKRLKKPSLLPDVKIPDGLEGILTKMKRPDMFLSGISHTKQTVESKTPCIRHLQTWHVLSSMNRNQIHRRG